MRTYPTSYDVVILGAGYAGLMAALRLSAWTCPLKALLISERGRFTERVRLQEALAAPLEPGLPPFVQWLGDTKLDFLEGRVTSLSPLEGIVIVQTARDKLAVLFERCIYALGSATDFELVPGAADHAFRLDPGQDPLGAAALRDRLHGAPGGARAVIVGGGNTAVEAAAQIKQSRPDFTVTLIAAHSVGDFGKGGEVERAVRGELVRQDVLLVDTDPVRAIDADHVVTGSGRKIAADLCILAAGLRSPEIAGAAGILVDEGNRIWVDGGLRSVSHPRILAIGDAARPIGPTGASYRPSALAALTSGAYAARSLVKEVRGKRYRPFSFSAYGQGVAIGRSGVGFLTFPDDGDGRFVVSGRIALSLRNLFVRLLIWLIRIEHAWPGLGLFWIGRRRVSWKEADSALSASAARFSRSTDRPGAIIPAQPQASRI